MFRIDRPAGYRSLVSATTTAAAAAATAPPDRTAQRARFDAATAHLDPPFALVDLDEFDANAAALVARAAGKPLRVAFMRLPR